MSSPVVPPLVQNATEVREGAAAELGVELVLAYAGMVALAVVPIWLGAWLAVRRKYSPRLPGADKEEAMTARDAYLFPVIGSAVLCSLYLLFKLLDKDYVNVLLTACVRPPRPPEPLSCAQLFPPARLQRARPVIRAARRHFCARTR